MKRIEVLLEDFEGEKVIRVNYFFPAFGIDDYKFTFRGKADDMQRYIDKIQKVVDLLKKEGTRRNE